MYPFDRTATTKYRRLGDLNNRNFLTVLEAKSLGSKCWLWFLLRCLFLS